jgi:hypothetical protein
VADAIHAAVLANQRAGPLPVPDLLMRDSGAQQLPTRHNPVRFARDPRKLLLDRPNWMCHWNI